MKHATLAAEPRTVVGKKVAKLRREGVLPANIYGHNVESRAISLDAHSFAFMYEHILPSTIIDLRVSGASVPVLLAHATTHPRSGRLTHVEFKQVNLREKVTAEVAVIGINQPALVTLGEAILLQSLDAILVNALPDDLPRDIEVDLSVLDSMDAAVHVSDLQVDLSKVEIITPGTELVFKLTAPQIREEVEAPAVVDVEAEPVPPTTN